ncbi:MAG: VWA domain-containing protein, partial [Myxococcales bacterium]
SFDDGAELLAAGAGGGSAVREANRRIDALTPRGGTDMVAGLSTGIEKVKAAYRQDRTNRVILLSDGVPNTANGLVEMARAATQKGIQVTTIGVGTDYNEDLMSKIADAGAGNYYFINDGQALASILRKELNELAAVVGREAVLKVEFASGVKPVKVFGYDAKLDNERAIIPLGDIFGGQNAEILVKVRHPKLEGDKLIAKVDLAFYDALKKADARDSRSISASFIGDAKAVHASVHKETAAKAEKIAAAEALNEAMEKVKQGRYDEARQQLATQRAQNAAAARSLGVASADVGEDTLAEFERKQQRIAHEREALEEYRHVEARTGDGRRIEVAANLGSAKEAADALEWGAEGVGL